MLLSLRDSGWLLASLLLAAASPTMSLQSFPHEALLKNAHTEFLSYPPRLKYEAVNAKNFDNSLEAAAFNSVGAILGKISRMKHGEYQLSEDVDHIDKIEGGDATKVTGETSMYRWMTQYDARTIGFSAQATNNPTLRPEMVFSRNYRKEGASRELGPGFISCKKYDKPKLRLSHPLLESEIPAYHVDAPFFVPTTTVFNVGDYRCAFTKTGRYPMPYAFYVVYLKKQGHMGALADLARNLVSTVSRLQLKGYIIRTIQPEKLMVSFWDDHLGITTLDNSWAMRGANFGTETMVFLNNDRDPFKRFMYRPPEMLDRLKTAVKAFDYDRWMTGMTALITVDMGSARLAESFSDIDIQLMIPRELDGRIAAASADSNSPGHWLRTLLNGVPKDRTWPNILPQRFLDEFAFYQGHGEAAAGHRAIFNPPFSLAPPPGSPDAEFLQDLEALTPAELANIKNSPGADPQTRLASLIIQVLNQRLVDPEKIARQYKLNVFVEAFLARRASGQHRQRAPIPHQILSSPRQGVPLLATGNMSPHFPDQVASTSAGNSRRGSSADATDAAAALLSLAYPDLQPNPPTSYPRRVSDASQYPRRRLSDAGSADASSSAHQSKRLRTPETDQSGEDTGRRGHMSLGHILN